MYVEILKICCVVLATHIEKGVQRSTGSVVFVAFYIINEFESKAVIHVQCT